MAATFPPGIRGIKKTGGNRGYPARSITEVITNGFFTMDRKWIVQYWNKAAETLLGVAAKDIVGKNLWEKFAGIIPLEFYLVYPKAFLLDVPFHFEEYWGEMGAWFDVIVYHCDDTLSVSFKSSNPLPTDHPDHPEQKLKIENELYRFVAEVSNDCLWEWNMKTNELFWIDGGHKTVFGYDIENAFIPRSFWESRLHPEDKGRILAVLDKIVSDGITTEWEDNYRFQKADGTYAYVHDQGYIIYDGEVGPARMIGTTLDITTAKMTEMKLAEAETKLSKLEYWINAQGQILQGINGSWERPDNNEKPITGNNMPGAEALPDDGAISKISGHAATVLAREVRKALGNTRLSVEMLISLEKDNNMKILLDIIMRNSMKIDHLMDMLRQ